MWFPSDPRNGLTSTGLQINLVDDLLPSEKLKRYNGRFCFQGNRVVDESGTWVVLSEICSFASLGWGARIVVAYALRSSQYRWEIGRPQSVHSMSDARRFAWIWNTRNFCLTWKISMARFMGRNDRSSLSSIICLIWSSSCWHLLGASLYRYSGE